MTEWMMTFLGFCWGALMTAHVGKCFAKIWEKRRDPELSGLSLRLAELEAWRKEDHVVNLSNRIARLENRVNRS